MQELKGASDDMKPRCAPGPDKIAPSFLKHLGPKALNQLLRLLNRCYRKGYIPQGWMPPPPQDQQIPVGAGLVPAH